MERSFGLTTDLYELTMAAAYFENNLQPEAIFELFVRSLPKSRSYLIAAGLEQALDYLSRLRFASDEIDYLREHPSFKRVSREFFDYLAQLRFTGDVWAVPEGRVVFEMEPLVRIKAPVIQAQVVETFLLSTINFQTLIASKAARVVTAARGRNVIEFGTRRAHGTEAGLLAARAAYIAGCAGTSNVEAGFLFGIPTFGTLAHSFVMLFDEEDDAFRAFLKVFPETATILVDTYDTVSAVERLAHGFETSIPAVRLDSGDLLELSVKVCHILDEAGKADTKIFASSDLDEYRIADLIARGAKIDAFGVGTQLATSYDAPAISGVYKLVGSQQQGRLDLHIKMSHEKATYPGPKQIWRLTDESGKYSEDIVAMADEERPDKLNEKTGGSWQPLLEQVMESGRIVGGQAISDRSGATRLREERFNRLNRARDRAAEELRRLPDELLALDCTKQYRVGFSERLMREKQRLENEHTRLRR